MSQPVTFAELKLYAECPCCEAQRDSHHEECTLAADDPASYRELYGRWQHNARVESLEQQVRALRDRIIANHRNCGCAQEAAALLGGEEQGK